MKHVSILVPVGDCSISNIEGPHQILCRVNDYLRDAGREPVFDKIITDEKNIYTSGGAYSWLNLILYLIEKYAGRMPGISPLVRPERLNRQTFFAEKVADTGVAELVAHCNRVLHLI